MADTLKVISGESCSIAISVTGIDDIQSVKIFINTIEYDATLTGSVWLLQLKSQDTQKVKAVTEYLSIVMESTSMGVRSVDRALAINYSISNAVSINTDAISEYIDVTIPITLESITDDLVVSPIIFQVYNSISGDVIEGPQGVPGIDGINGVDGEDGAQGIQGIPGEQGPAGEDGIGGSGSLLTENLPITKATTDTFSTAFALVNDGGNAQGNDAIITTAIGIHNVGASIATLGGLYNGRLRIEGAPVLAGAVNQTSTIRLDSTGYLNFVSNLDIKISFLKIEFDSSAQHIPFVFSKNNTVEFYRCYIDYSAIQAVANLFTSGQKVILNECALEGHASIESNIGNNTNIELYNCVKVNDTPITNGLSGYGTIMSGGSDNLCVNYVTIGSPGQELGTAATPSFESTEEPTAGLTLTTQAVDTTLDVSATAHATITDLGASTVTDYGFVYGTSPNPIAADGLIDFGLGAVLSAYSGSLAGLIPETTYYVRPYATNADGITYGPEVSFTTIAAIVASDLIDPVQSAITAITGTSFQMNFTDPNSAPNAEYLIVSVDTSALFDSGTPMEIWYLGADLTSYVVSNTHEEVTLVSGITYYARVKAAHDDAGINDSDWSNVESVIIP